MEVITTLMISLVGGFFIYRYLEGGVAGIIAVDNRKHRLTKGSPYYKVVPIQGGNFGIEKTTIPITPSQFMTIPLSLLLYETYDTVEEAKKEIKHLKSLDT